MKVFKFIILFIFFISCENTTDTLDEEGKQKMTSNYVIMSYLDIYGEFYVDDFREYCKGKNDEKCFEIDQIESLINKILECSGGIYTEKENYSYPDPYNRYCVSSVLLNQLSYEKNLIDTVFLEKVSKMYLHEAISVLRIRYYYSFSVLGGIPAQQRRNLN